MDSPSLSAQVLLAHLLDCDRLDLITHPERSLTPQEIDQFQKKISRRAQGVPVAYLTGSKEFFGLDFYVNQDVLIPRPETECIVEEVLHFFPRQSAPLRIADLGTGSGALAISLAFNYPAASVAGTDICSAALQVAKNNIRRHAQGSRLILALSDFGSCLADDSFDVVVSNPPYIGPDEFATLSPEVSAFEPEKALLAGENGTRFYSKLARDAQRILKRNGRVLAEIGCSQGQDVTLAFRGFADVRVIKDLAGLDRIVVGRKP